MRPGSYRRKLSARLGLKSEMQVGYGGKAEKLYMFKW